MRSTLALLALAWLVAPPAAAQTRTEMAPMRDGVRLATDLYLPAGDGPFAALLVRTPYDKGALTEAGDGVSALGMAVVVQDMRGRFASEGVDCVFRCDAEDGQDTMAWIAAQGWYGGPIVTYGGSALGIVQYMAAPGAPDDLAGMWVEVGTPTVYEHAFFQGGAFRQRMIEGWLENQGSAFFLDDVKAHPTMDAFWESVQTDGRFAEVNVPAVHWGGWYDIFLQGTIDAFRGYQHQGGDGARGQQMLVMGPWVHGGWGRREQGDLVFPEASIAPPLGDNFPVRWVLHRAGILREDTIDALDPVHYWVLGDVDDPAAPGNEWRSASDWPIPTAPVRVYLGPDGALAEACPPDGGGSTPWTYDPAAPTPTAGGANLILPSGPHDQRAVEARDDTVVFETGPVDAPLEITGRVRAHLFVTTDTVDTDVVVRLTDVYPDGRSMLVLDGVQRLSARNGPDRLEPVTPGEVVQVTVDLWSTSIVLAPGHRLRVSIGSSNAPRFWPNPNDGTSYGGDPTPAVAHVAVHHAADHPSWIELPDPTRDPSSVLVCGETPTIDAGVAADAGSPGDAGRASSTEDGGCGCRVTRAPSTLGGLLFALLLAAAALRRSAS